MELNWPPVILGRSKRKKDKKGNENTSFGSKTERNKICAFLKPSLTRKTLEIVELQHRSIVDILNY
jgi:hypothetical protein